MICFLRIFSSSFSSWAAFSSSLLFLFLNSRDTIILWKVSGISTSTSFFNSKYKIQCINCENVLYLPGFRCLWRWFLLILCEFARCCGLWVGYLCHRVLGYRSCKILLFYHSHQKQSHSIIIISMDIVWFYINNIYFTLSVFVKRAFLISSGFRIQNP